MIEIKNLTKRFDDTVALNNMNVTIAEGTIFGLTVCNGSGKSTLLRTLSGVYRPDDGEVIIDGENSFDNHAIKERCYYIADYPYFFNDSTVIKMAALMKKLYGNWSDERFSELCKLFPIDTNKKIINMSKGIQRQASLILAFASRPKYLFLDEISDGLDPVIRKTLKTLIVQDVTDNDMTCIIASHNLAEIDDICDNIVMLNEGHLLANADTDIIKDRVHKIQLAFNEKQPDYIFDGMDVQIINKIGNYYSIIARGNKLEILGRLEELNPAFLEVLPATLEEVFISTVKPQELTVEKE